MRSTGTRRQGLAPWLALGAAMLAIAGSSPPSPWVRVQLPEPGRAGLEARTVSGRLLFSREIAALVRGSSSLLVAESAAYPSDVYFLKLAQEVGWRA